MTRTHNIISEANALELGQLLRTARTLRNATLTEAQEVTKINVGQLSRLERGDFRRASKNLQKYAEYLQIGENEIKALQSANPATIANRVEEFASKSRTHRDVVERIIGALERLA